MGSSSTHVLIRHEGLLCSEQALHSPEFSAALLSFCRHASAPVFSRAQSFQSQLVAARDFCLDVIRRVVTRVGILLFSQGAVAILCSASVAAREQLYRLQTPLPTTAEKISGLRLHRSMRGVHA